MSSEDQQSTPAGGWRLRLSLLEALLLMTVVAMGIALWRIGFEIVPLRDEVARLRDEAGYINVGNPEHLHVHRIWTPESSKEEVVYRWRMYIPEGKPLYLHNQTYRIPKQGVPKLTGLRDGSRLTPGERVFDLRIVQDPESESGLIGRMRGYYEGALATQVFGDNFHIRERQQKGWTVPHEESGWQQFWVESDRERQTASYPTDKPVVLLRLRAGKVHTDVDEETGSRQWRSEKYEGECDGLILWVSDKSGRIPE